MKYFKIMKCVVSTFKKLNYFICVLHILKMYSNNIIMQTQQDKQVLLFANKATELCQQFGKTITVPVPEIKVVGAQSAGKSSLTERMIGLNILPTGDTMVTRTPIRIRMTNIPDMTSIRIKLSRQRNGELEHVNIIEFNMTDKDKDQKIDQFKLSVSKLTDEVTGGKYLVSKTPLFIDIESNKVSNFSFVDLPGIIMTALSDKGQSRELPEQIRNLIKEELSIPNTIALVVIRTGNDLETDPGIALINEVKMIKGDCSFGTVGVLTKADLLGDSMIRNNLNNLIAGRMLNKDENLSNNLMMSEGFFVVNNTCPTFKDENEYFLKNFDNNREIVSDARYGVENLQTHLQSLLSNSVRKLMPQIKANLSDILKVQKQKARSLGVELKTEQEKMSYFIQILAHINRLVRDSIYSYGSQNVAGKIGEAQNIFSNKIKSVKPFDTIQDEYFQKMINSFNGYNMTPQITIEQLAKKCMKDESNKPITLILPIAEEYINFVVSTLNENVKQILESEEITNLGAYPKLKTKICQTLTNKIKSYGKNAIDAIKSNLVTEGSFFWSNDESFKQVLDEQFLPKPIEDDRKDSKKIGFSTSVSYKKEESNLTRYSYKPSQVRLLMSTYYGTITKSVEKYVIKVTVEKVLNELEDKVMEELNILQTTIENGDSITNYIVETESCANKRATINNTILKLETAIKYANGYE